MRQILSLIVIVGVLLATAISPLAAAEQANRAAGAPAIADQYIVVVNPGRDARGLAHALGVTPKRVFHRVLNGFVATLNAGQRTALEHHPDVALVEPDQLIVSTATQTTSATAGLWGLDRIDQRALPLSGNYTYTTTGAGVTAYIIDTELQANHPDFGNRAQNVFDAFDGTGADCQGHGTHLAGIVGGITYGIAKQVNLRGVRVIDCYNQGTTANAIAGIDWVATNAVKPAVATLAFTPINPTTTLEIAIDNLITSGVFVAVSAGNNNVDGCGVAPAKVAAAFTVAASTNTDTRSPFSSYGTCVDSYAPGSGITSAWNGSGTNTVSGTSQATAFAAGVAALYKATYGDAPQATINSWLITNSTQNVIQNNPAGTPNRLLYSPQIMGSVTPRSVDAGYEYTCGLRSDGSIVCWGRNDYGQLTVPSGTFTQVSAGFWHACGLRSDGSIVCWGSNGYGKATPPTGTFTQISAGGKHGCGLRTNGSLACWGNNAYGQATPPTGTFTQVSTGDTHSCGLRSDGSIVCWGNNEYGQLTSPSGTFTQVSDGDKHTCGVRTDGSLACWGLNSYGQATPPSGTFTQVGASGAHTCALRTDSTLACWGLNTSGQITPPSGTFTQVSKGNLHACGVRTDGSLACWGANYYGQATPPTNWY